MKKNKLTKRSAISLAVSMTLCVSVYAWAAADPSAYQRDRLLMSAQGAKNASETASVSSEKTQDPDATKSAAQSTSNAKLSAPGSELKQNDNGNALKAPVNAAHNFTPGNGSATTDDQNTVSSLLKQARFWHDKYQPSLARQSLSRVLLSDPNNAEALYLMSLWSSETGDNENAEQYRRRLELAHPNDTRLQTLKNERDLASYSKDQLRKARELASSGNIPAALVAYRQMFPNGAVPRSLLNEYYLTMSGDPQYFNEALQGIGNYIRKHPQDNDAKITYGKLLSYNEKTRRDGIEVLDYYAKDNQEADRALRQALLWLMPSNEDEKYYRSYLSRHPQDGEIRNRFATAITDTLNQDAYSSFRKQNTALAKSQFADVLKRDPNNAQALEGLGYLYQATGDFGQAALNLAKAANTTSDPSKKAKLAYDAEYNSVRAMEKGGDLRGAVKKLNDLLKNAGPDHNGMLLYRASMEQRLGLHKEAEEDLKAVLADDPADVNAGEMLYYTLKNQGKSAEAKSFLDSLPSDLRRTILARETAKADPTVALREKAKAQIAAGDLNDAVQTLTRALKASPKDPWLNHDLGLVKHRLGDDYSAREQVRTLLSLGTSASLFAAASLQNALGDDQNALATLKRLPASYNAKGLSELRKSLTLRQGMREAEEYLKAGRKTAALNTLTNLEQSQGSVGTADLGHMSYLYLQAGNTQKALELSRRVLSSDIPDDATLDDYADVITVLNSLRLYDDARSLASDPRLLRNSDRSRLASLSNAQTIREADTLRENGRSADAYDLLYQALQTTPHDPALMSAMARIYHDNDRLDEAEAIYDRVLQYSPDDENALIGAVNTALANDHGEKALNLVQRISREDPDTLYLKARVAEQTHHYREAITYLRQTKSMLEGSPYISDPLAVQGSAAVKAQASRSYNNPFRNTNEITARSQSNTPNMPWEVSSQTAKVDPASYYMFDHDEIDRRRTLGEVNDKLRSLYELTSTSVSFDAEGRQKDGEDGLSKLSDIRGNIKVSTPVFDDNRLTATVTVGSAKSGSPNADSNRKYGSNALMMAAQSLANRLNALSNAAKAAVNTDRANSTGGTTVTAAVDALASQMHVSSSVINAIANRGYVTGAEMAAINMTSDTWMTGLTQLMSNFGLDVNNNDQMTALMYNYTDSSYGMTPGSSISDHGASFNLALEGPLYRADIGSTPIGKDGSTFTGGIYLHPRLDKNTELRLNLERRAVEDSILSYYGVKDEYSGTYYGAVTQNGGSVGLAWDNGSYGSYGNVSYYYYKGENVRSNSSYGISLGAYARPIYNSVQTLQAGVNFDYMTFKHNENLFTTGHGGYFSPKDYYALSFPVDLKRKYNENLELTLGASIGYQSYTNQAEDYFPTNSSWQSLLNTMVAGGLAPASRFAQEDKDGISGSVKFGLDYRFTDAFSVNALFNYSTFGDYKEANELLTFKYLTGVDAFF